MHGQPGARRGATVEINAGKGFKRHSATLSWGKPFPWAEAHGYHPGLAPRGSDSFSKIEMRPGVSIRTTPTVDVQACEN
jgi:hypothetical protein